MQEFGLRRAQSCRSGTRRRPIGRDYAAAKDAECGKERHSAGLSNEDPSSSVGLGRGQLEDCVKENAGDGNGHMLSPQYSSLFHLDWTSILTAGITTSGRGQHRSPPPTSTKNIYRRSLNYGHAFLDLLVFFSDNLKTQSLNDLAYPNPDKPENA